MRLKSVLHFICNKENCAGSTKVNRSRLFSKAELTDFAINKFTYKVRVYYKRSIKPKNISEYVRALFLVSSHQIPRTLLPNMENLTGNIQGKSAYCLKDKM